MPQATLQFANAYPRKRFFVEMFTRDIALEDCVLDLIDNSIDALIRLRKLNLERDIIKPGRPASPATIDVIISPTEVSISDDCGGINIDKAKNEVFNFGHTEQGATDLTSRGIGAYGIGLKRAIFKMGRHFQVDSSHKGRSFRVEQNLLEWVDDDTDLSDWRFPLTEKPVRSLDCIENGTHIKITSLYESIKHLAKSETFVDDLRRAISRTYSLFLGNYLNVTVNERVVEPVLLPFGEGDEYKPATDVYSDDGVSVRLSAGLARRGPKGEWQMERAGWYVLCNGRIVVSADKTALTGWGAGILPQFHSSKGRGFVGVALFTSDDPLKLPWTTTKRGLNRESPVYLRARNKMQSVARPVYSYLESISPKDERSSSEEIATAKTITQAPTRSLLVASKSSFSPPRSRTPSDKTNIQFRASKKEIEAVKRHLGRPGMSAGDVGRHAFEYFLENEEIL